MKLPRSVVAVQKSSQQQSYESLVFFFNYGSEPEGCAGSADLAIFEIMASYEPTSRWLWQV